MSKRFLICSLVLAMPVVLRLWLVWPRAISPTNYRKIRFGMTPQQVETAIGDKAFQGRDSSMRRRGKVLAITLIIAGGLVALTVASFGECRAAYWDWRLKREVNDSFSPVQAEQWFHSNGLECRLFVRGDLTCIEASTELRPFLGSGYLEGNVTYDAGGKVIFREMRWFSTAP